MMAQRDLRDYLGPTITKADMPRIGRVDRANLAILLDGQWHKSTELHGIAAHSSMSRLRAAGHDVQSRRDPAAPTSGVWLYRLVLQPPGLEGA